MSLLRRYIREQLQPLQDPLWNVREICKELTLLEGHLNNEDQRCDDCISKHLLRCEALAEEAISLDSEGVHSFLFALPNMFRKLHNQILDKIDPREISMICRDIRKKLMPLSAECFEC